MRNVSFVVYVRKKKLIAVGPCAFDPRSGEVVAPSYSEAGSSDGISGDCLDLCR